jgi:hypothetical protein
MADTHRYFTKGQTDANVGASAVVTGDLLHFSEGSQTVSTNIGTGSLLQTLAGGLRRLDFAPAFVGTIGGGSYGSLKVDVDTGTNPYVSYAAGGGSLFLEAGGGSALITRFLHCGQGSAYLTGGTFTRVEHKGKYTSIATAATVTSLYQSGGEVRAQIPSGGTPQQNAFQTIVIDGGGAYLERFLDSNGTAPTALITGGANVMVGQENSSGTNLPVATGSSGGTLTVADGLVTWRGGNIGTLIVYGNGRFDASSASSDFSITTLIVTEKAMKNCRFRSKFCTITLPSTLDTDLFVLAGDTTDLLA